MFVNFTPHAVPMEIGITIIPTPSSDPATEVDVAALITIVQPDFELVGNLFCFLCFSYDKRFSSPKEVNLFQEV